MKSSRLVLAAFFSLSFLISSFADSGRREIERLQNELETTRLQIDFLDLRSRDVLSQQRTLEKRVATQKKKLKELDKQIVEIKARYDSTRLAIEQLQLRTREDRARFDSVVKRFKGRLVHLHKTRQSSLIAGVFSSADLNTFLNRYQMVRYLLVHDREMIEKLVKERDVMRSRENILHEEQRKLEGVRESLNKVREEQDHQVKALSAMLQTLVMERKLLVERQKGLAKSSEKMESEISRLAAAQVRTPPSDVKVPRGKKPPPQVYSSAHAGKAQKKGRHDPPSSEPRFLWPVREINRVTHKYDQFSVPRAIEIQVTGEQDVIATAKGRVSFRGPLGQLGNVVILAHGQGFSTVSGNLDEILVGLGQVIESGVAIGRIYGWTNNLFYYEIRFGGSTRNPLELLASRD